MAAGRWSRGAGAGLQWPCQFFRIIKENNRLELVVRRNCLAHFAVFASERIRTLWIHNLRITVNRTREATRFLLVCTGGQADSTDREYRQR